MGALYSGVSITGYNANPPDDDGSQTEANRVKWETIKEKITDPTKVRTDSMDTALQASFGKIDAGVTSTAISYAVIESDQGKLVRASASGVTITTPDATDVGAPFVFDLVNDSSGDITLDGFSAQTVDGDASITIPAGCGLRVRTNGSNWFTSGQNFPTPVVYPPAGLFTNLVIKVTGNTGLTVAADSIVVSDGTTSKALTGVSHTINMATTGANALDAGSIAQATWYAIWEIAQADGTKAALASASFTTPTLPTDYIHKARIGAVRTKSNAAQLLGTWQFGRRAQYKVGLAQTSATTPIMDSGIKGDKNTPTWAAVSVSSFVPPTASEIVGTLHSFNAAAMAAPSNSYEGMNSTTSGAPVSNSSTISWSIPFNFVLESTNIYWASDGANGQLVVQGWVDNF